MKNWRCTLTVTLFLLLVPVAVLAKEPQLPVYPYDDHVFVPNFKSHSTFEADFTPALLNRGRDGYAWLGDIEVNYVSPAYDIQPRYNWHIKVFVGGENSDVDDAFGFGNVECGFKWRVLRKNSHSLAVGMDMTWPIAQEAAGNGVSTADFTGYFHRAFGFRPGAYHSWYIDNFSISSYATIDLLLLTESPPPLDVAELYANYGSAVHYAFNQKLHLTGEVMAVTELTPAQANTSLWAGPGIIWDQESYVIKAGAQFTVLGDAYNTIAQLIRIGFVWRL